MQKNKNLTIEQIQDKFEYLTRMTKNRGHSSWWYSNRGSEDCINVKIYADIKDLKLSEKEERECEIIGINTDNIIDARYWYTINNEAEELLSNLQSKLDTDNMYISDVNFTGRQGGWACIVYSFDELYKIEEYLNLEDKEITKKNTKEITKIINDCEDFINKTNKEVLSLKRSLINYLESNDFIDDVKEEIKDTISFNKDLLIKKIDDLIKD